MSESPHIRLQVDGSEITLRIEDTIYTVTELIGVINYLKNLSQMDAWEIGIEADSLRSKAISLIGKSKR